MSTQLKSSIISLCLLCLFYTAKGQETDTLASLNNTFRNTLYTSKFGIAQVGGYAQIDYNQPLSPTESVNGNLDVHRLVIFLGHKFTDRLSFFTEIEVEHVKEIYVEQAFLEYKLTDWMNLRAGLLLTPMGIVNEYHEPPTFNGVERPNLDKYIVPTTWREIGIGFAGNLRAADINYQLYVMNGPLGYDGSARFRGVDGIRKGRQKGAESTFSANPNWVGKINYYGFLGLNIGLAGYIGKSESTLYNGLDHSNGELLAQADSSVVHLSMVGLDARYVKRGFEARGEIIYMGIGNTEQYNAFGDTDLGSSLFGYYAEIGYDFLSFTRTKAQKLVLFVRYEQYDTQFSVSNNIEMNNAYSRADVTIGLHYRPTPNVSFKGDYQILEDASSSIRNNQLNFGVGAWF